MRELIESSIQQHNREESAPANLLQLMGAERKHEVAPAPNDREPEHLSGKPSLIGDAMSITRSQLECLPATRLSTFLKKNFDDLDHLSLPSLPNYSVFYKQDLNIGARRGLVGLGDIDVFSRLADPSKRAAFVNGEFAAFKMQHEINRGAEQYLSAIPKGAIVGGLIMAIALRRPAGLLRTIGVGGGIAVGVSIPLFGGLGGMEQGRREADLLLQDRLSRVNRIMSRGE